MACSSGAMIAQSSKYILIIIETLRSSVLVMIMQSAASSTYTVPVSWSNWDVQSTSPVTAARPVDHAHEAKQNLLKAIDSFGKCSSGVDDLLEVSK